MYIKVHPRNIQIIDARVLNFPQSFLQKDLKPFTRENGALGKWKYLDLWGLTRHWL